jgi:uncharacterized protein HemX
MLCTLQDQVSALQQELQQVQQQLEEERKVRCMNCDGHLLNMFTQCRPQLKVRGIAKNCSSKAATIMLQQFDVQLRRCSKAWLHGTCDEG